MNRATNQWGIELIGNDDDKERWRVFLKPPFDPFVEEVEHEHGNYLALRSSGFDGLTTSKEVHDAGKQLFRTLNVVMAKNADADPIVNSAVIEFVPDGKPRKHIRIEAEAGMMRLRGGIVEVTVSDSDGNVIEPPPAPSRAQLWMRATDLKPDIGSALRYMEGKPGWIELYKAYEAIREFPNSGISEKEERRFRQTANTDGRHHPSPKFPPHEKPMEIWEARSLITQWISAAIDDVLAKNP
ncbi:hypothetical protein [Oricola nitratireducens]|uniref:hypothetical protein n=1 Tax=Oricola nitratireducens TaxID=2775868 RepID=UPI001865DAAA|nr:hypothetical protein [Oricola nitratireducens]